MCRQAIVFFIAAALSGCVVGPDYRRPGVDVPAAWRLGTLEASEISNVLWWDQFQDPVLSHLVRTAIENNTDLKIAAANVDRAFAQYGIVRSALFPEIDAQASVARERFSGNGPQNVAGGVGVVNIYDVNVAASYELDVWGRLRRATESARASLLASQEGRRTVVLTVATSTANGYIQLRGLDKQLEIARHTLESRREVLRLQQARFEGGIAPESDFRQAESQYQAAAAEVPELERLIANQENFLSVVLGANPGPIQRGRTLDDLLFPGIPAGLPSAILEQRPDVREAEQNLIAANADIGVARAAYFPQISLTALLGVQSVELSALFQGTSKTWSFGGSLLQPIFNGRRIRSQVAEAEAVQRASLYSYRRSIISAFQEVENALIDRTKFGQTREEQTANVTALRRYLDLAELRYREGATIYLEVANAQALLFEAELSLTQTQAQLFQTYANLYKAMGGGWVLEAEKLAGKQ
jgi:outer membrane protein, multidrug efflux system